MALLITDLDNTLYDWVTYFARSFTAMVDSLVEQTGLPRDQLLDEFKAVHQRYGDSEQPFAVLELPCIQDFYGSLSRQELMKKLDVSLHAFNSARKRYLRLYGGVAETLRELRDAGVTIIGHTEALAENAYFRLNKLEILPYFSHLYALKSNGKGHPDPARAADLRLPEDIVRLVPREERKPNPALIVDLCEREGKSLAETWYVGDSITRDVSMAKEAGVWAVWARYGRAYEKSDWDALVRITHWTAEDVRREEVLRKVYADATPDYEIAEFSDLLNLIPVRSSTDVSGEFGRRAAGG